MEYVLSLTERQWQRVVTDYATFKQWRWVHYKPARTPDGKYLTRLDGAAGFPDLCLVRGKRLLFVELKGEKGRLSEGQDDWLAALEETGVECYVWKPADWDDVERVLS